MGLPLSGISREPLPAQTVIRPSCVVRIQMRLDEGTNTSGLQTELERQNPEGPCLTTEKQASNAQAKRAALRSIFEKQVALSKMKWALSDQDYDRQRSALDKQKRQVEFSGALESKPFSIEQDIQDDYNVNFTVTPTKVTIERNEVHDAGTCTVTFLYRDMPIDPRCVRSALITVTIGTVSQLDYNSGMLDQQTRFDKSLVSTVDSSLDAFSGLNPATQFVGYIDRWHIKATDDGDEIEVECRDMSAILRDTDMIPKFGIDLTQPIAVGVQDYINRYVSGGAGIKVIYGVPMAGAIFIPDLPAGPVPQDVPPATPVTEINLDLIKPGTSPSLANALAITAKSRAGKRAVGRRESKMKAWDHIVLVAAKLALIPVMRGFTLYIIEPRTLFQNVTNGRVMMYGANILSLEFNRKFGRVKSPSIEVRCSDPLIGKERWARYPVKSGENKAGVFGELNGDPVKSRASDVSPGGTPDETYMVYPVTGITDALTLERIAASIFEQVGRQEIEGSCETHDITSFQSADEADLLNLQSGEPVQIKVLPTTEQQTKTGLTGATFQQLSEMSAATRQAYLQGHGFAVDTAKKIAKAQEIVPLNDTFRVGHVNIEWSNDDGVSITFDFHNFIVIREQDKPLNAPALSAAALTNAFATVGSGP